MLAGTNASGELRSQCHLMPNLMQIKWEKITRSKDHPITPAA
jgi:hypothetical protein